MASSACGNGPSGPSFDASLTTRSRPSSRWTSSTGFPGSYGTRPASAGRTKPAGASLTLRAVAERAVGLLAPEQERRERGCAEPRDGALVQSGVLAFARNGLLGLPLACDLRALPNPPAEHGVASIHDGHVRSFPDGRA